MFRRHTSEASELTAELARRMIELETANQGLRQITAILDNSLEAIVSLDVNYLITGWNRAAERMFGYQAAEVMGSPVSILATADLAMETGTAIELFLTGAGPSTFETVRVCKNGTKIDVHDTLSAITDGAGAIQGTSLVKRDITERKLAHEILRVAVEAAPSAMVMADQNGRIVLVNSQTETLFQYSRTELRGQPVDMLVPRTRLPDAERYGVRRDGVEFPVEIGLNPIRMSGDTWVLSSIVDITERQRGQLQIMQLNQDLERRVMERTQELSAANADLESFSYTVAHDLRAPLRHIAGFAHILAEEHGTGMNEEARRHLNRVQEGAQSMGNLIDHLLNLAKLGRQPVMRELTRLNPLVETARASLSQESLSRRIEWSIGELGSAPCDPGLMQQVFVNLLSNAVKYTRLRETAVIEVERTMCRGEQVISVRDNGAGFDMQYAGKLFGVFQRMHRARDFEGTGVGLATVQRIVAKHGGRVWADAQVDKGATFSFTIPFGDELGKETHDAEEY